MTINRPMVGVGMGNFHIYSIREKEAHNAYLEIAAELGVMGLIACWIVIFAISLTPSDRTPNQGHAIEERTGDVLDEREHTGGLHRVHGLQLFASIQYLWYLCT